MNSQIESARDALSQPATAVLTLFVGGTALTVTVRATNGQTWHELVHAHPRRQAAELDAATGYDVCGLTRAYPPECITVAPRESGVSRDTPDGEASLSSEEWWGLVDGVTAQQFDDIATVVWAVNRHQHFGSREEVIALALETGVSPRRLYGWEPAEITTHEYDDKGRLVSTVTVREPEFTSRDRADLLAARRERDAPRGPHGRKLSESTDVRNERMYTVPIPLKDYAQVAINKEKARWVKEYPDEDWSTRLWYVEHLGDQTTS